MRNTTTIATIVALALIVTGLLIKNRLDTAPEQQDIVLSNTYCTADMAEDTCWQDIEDEDPYTLESNNSHYREYLVGETQFSLDHDTLLSVDGDRFRFDTGRVVADGSATLTVRDVAVMTDGVVTLVHYSWLDKLDVKVLEGSASVRQGDYTSTVSAGNAVSIDTLPPYDAIAQTTFNTDANPFYEWALE